MSFLRKFKYLGYYFSLFGKWSGKLVASFTKELRASIFLYGSITPWSSLVEGGKGEILPKFFAYPNQTFKLHTIIKCKATCSTIGPRSSLTAGD